jgi:hypothetical protein
MSDDDWEALGRRAVACARWRRLPGMRIRPDGEIRPWDAYRLCAEDEREDPFQQAGVEGGKPGEIPDLRDAATVGCLLALVREAWGSDACVVSSEDQIDGVIVGIVWSVEGARIGDRVISREDGEAEALVAALEAAP